MSTPNPYESPEQAPSAQGRPSPQVTPLLVLAGIAIGMSGGLFIATASYVLIFQMWLNRSDLAELSAIPIWLIAAVLVGIFSVSSSSPSRGVAWAIGGFGAGLIFEGMILRALSVGTFLTISGFVFAIVFCLVGVLRVRVRSGI